MGFASSTSAGAREATTEEPAEIEEVPMEEAVTEVPPTEEAVGEEAGTEEAVTEVAPTEEEAMEEPTDADGTEEANGEQGAVGGTEVTTEEAGAVGGTEEEPTEEEQTEEEQTEELGAVGGIEETTGEQGPSDPMAQDDSTGVEMQPIVVLADKGEGTSRVVYVFLHAPESDITNCGVHTSLMGRGKFHGVF